MQTTRQQILEHLQRHGRATVKELGQVLRLTSTGIRQHLTVLERDGLVVAREERGRVGRPTLVYTLTEKAETLFPKGYDELATALLEEIRAEEGSERLYELLHRVAQRLAESFWERVQGKSLAQRVEETALILQEQGCLVDWEPQDGEFLLHEFTCPLSKMAKQDSSVCTLHLELVRLLTGADTRLVRSLLRGERACTYRIRPLAAEGAP
ncbi:MAG: winged helix-turn-helix transcriptional regulator [Dehalococcoidia bacterium]|nr:MAG: winged helix-turn-helix transcriptional regulator [Dehalococcoidia bacterium]